MSNENPDKKKLLLLTFGDIQKKDIFLEKINQIRGMAASPIFKPQVKLIRALRRIWVKNQWPIMDIWFLNFQQKIKNADIIVIIASQYSPYILKYLSKKYKNKRFINYYWDKIQISKYPIIKDNAYENWTFDKQDADKYGMKYNSQFFVDTLQLNSNREIDYDICFVGADREGLWKERTEIVNIWYEQFENMNLKVFFYYVSSQNKDKKSYIHSKRIPQNQYLEYVAKSKAVLEIVQPGCEWITLRPLLALSNKKKVITNNKYIKDEMCYSKENVFILGVDDLADLPQFLNSEFKEIEHERLWYYSITAWKERFFEGSRTK